MNYLVRFISLLVVLAMGFLIVHIFHLNHLTPEYIQEFILSFGWWAPLLYIVLYTIRPLFLFPAVMLTLSGGMTFGPWKGTMLDIIGASLGAYLAFGLARGLGKEALQKWIGNKLRRLDYGIERHGFRTILLLRLIPLIPFDALNYGAGLSKVRFRDYALATPIGMLPAAFAYNLLGHSLHHVFSPSFYIALVLVAFLMLLQSACKKVKSSRQPS